MDKKKPSLLSKLKDRYRVNVINPENFEEISSFTASWLQVLMLFSVVFIIAFGIGIALLVYSPLNSYLVDPKGKTASDPYTIKLSMLADSLAKEVAIQSQFIENQLAILNGEDGQYAVDEADAAETPNQEVDETKLFYVSPEDSAIRKELENDIYSLKTPKAKSAEALHFYPPVNGIVNEGFNSSSQHFAVDIISERDAPVQATLDGTVIFSEFSSTTGNVIVIQHLNNYLSVYKHNSVLLKQVGNFVRAGETIAIIGNSGEATSGPHLHFELWQNGRPINPENFIVF